MMKKGFILFTILLLTVKLYSQDAGIYFIDSLSWNQIKGKAKKEGKFIFMDIYATWCGPCKIMDSQVYHIEHIGNLLNDKFISVKVQQDESTKDNAQVRSWYSDAKAIIQGYNIKALPSFLFFSPDGKLVHRGVGVQDSSAFVKMVQLSLTDPIGIYQKQLSMFKKGKRDKFFLYNLALMANEQVDIKYIDKIEKAYIVQIKQPYNVEDLKFLQKTTSSNNDIGFNFIIKHAYDIEKIPEIGENMLEIVRNIIRNEVSLKLGDTTKNLDLKVIEKEIVSKYGNIGESVVWNEFALYYYDKNDFNNWFEIKLKIYDRYPTLTSIVTKNDDAWFLFQNSSDKKQLETALAWSEEVIKKEPTANFYDTYANLLYKLGRTQDAIKIQEKGVKLTQGNGYIENAMNNLEKMRKGEPTWPVNN